MSKPKPYGMRADGTARCVNSEPGHYNHECGKPARWIGEHQSSSACYCDDCKAEGWEARRARRWTLIERQGALVPPATTAERIAHRAAQPLAPRKPQAQPGGMFDTDARAQIDLCDAIQERSR